MPYIQVQDVRHGMDRKRDQRVVGDLGTAWTIKNGHLSRGGDIQRRKKFVKQSGAFPSTTSGLYAINKTLYTTGYSAAQAGNVPPGVTHLLTQHPTPATPIRRTLDAKGFDGKLYAVIEFTDGNIYHYYGTARVTDWDTLSASIGSNNALAAALAAAIDNSSAVSTSFAGNVITITSSTAGIPFTISQNTVNNGFNPNQSITLAQTQPNVVAASEILAKATLTITGGTANPGINSLLTVTIDGVDILGASVDYDTSNSVTAAAIAAQINTFTSSPDYTATSSGPTVTISALAGTGAAPNGFVVTTTKSGDLTETHQATLSGGVTSTSAAAQVYTATIGGTFETADQFTITINGESFTLTGGASGTGTSVLTFKKKLYSTASANLYFSALNAPTQWISGTDYGFINMASQTAGQENLTVAEEYQGLMVIFSENNIRIWSISEDSSANVFIQTLQNTGTIAPRSVIPYGSNDVFYLSSSGIRSIKARDSSNAAYVSDVGTPIDTHIRDYMSSLTQEEVRDAVGIVEPIDGRFWLGIKNRIYVLSYFPSAKISAWSYYEVDFDIKNFAKVGDQIYVRGTDSDGIDYLYLYGGFNNATYPAKNEDICTIELPYFSASDPAGNKHLFGFDIVGINSWNVDLLPDPNNDQITVSLGIATGVTYGQPRFGVDGITPLFALTLTCSEAGPATMSALAMHYDGTFDIG